MKKKEKEHKKDIEEQEEPVLTGNEQEEKLENAETETDDEEADEEQVSGERDIEVELAESKDKYLRLYSEFDNLIYCKLLGNELW